MDDECCIRVSPTRLVRPFGAECMLDAALASTRGYGGLFLRRNRQHYSRALHATPGGAGKYKRSRRFDLVSGNLNAGKSILTTLPLLSYISIIVRSVEAATCPATSSAKKGPLARRRAAPTYPPEVIWPPLMPVSWRLPARSCRRIGFPSPLKHPLAQASDTSRGIATILNRWPANHRRLAPAGFGSRADWRTLA